MSRYRHPGRVIAGLFAGVVISLAAVAADGPILELHRDTPRPFGYVMGDVIRHEITLVVPEEFVLLEEVLPDGGPLNYWLELRDRQVRETARGSRREYRITLEYQVFRASRDVRGIQIPELELAVGTGERAEQVSLPPWEFSISPLLDTRGVRVVDGRIYMRPAEAPPREDARGHALRAVAWGGLLLVVAGWSGGRRLYRRLVSRTPFECACRELVRLRRQDAGDDTARQAMLVMHRAFDATAGRPVFAEDVPALVAERPGLQPLQPSIEAFFARSRRCFFGEGGSGQADDTATLRDLVSLGRACRRWERGA